MIGVKVDQAEAEETGTPVTMLSFPLLTQLPDPFFREYAELYKVPIHFRSDGTLPRDMGELRSMAMKILLAGSRTANPPAVPVLQGHVAKMVGEVLYVRYRSADPGELGVFPIERLGEPVDDYSDEEMAKVEEKRKKKELKKKQKKAARGPKTMPFVFPPQAGGEKDFLAAMLADLKSESAHAVDMYTKAQVALQEAMYDLACMREETAVERRMWERLWKDVARAAGEDAVQDVALRVQVRVRGGVPDDELDAGIEDGDLEKTRWQTRPVKRSPPPLSPSPPPKSLPLAPPAPPAAALDPVPIIIPTLVNPNSTFGGNATTFDQGAFLKRRRSGDPAESDVESDSDESDGPRKRKSPVRAPPPGLASQPTSNPLARRMAQPFHNPPMRRASSKRSAGNSRLSAPRRLSSRRSRTPHAAAGSQDVPVLSALPASALGLLAFPSPNAVPASRSALFSVTPR